MKTSVIAQILAALFLAPLCYAEMHEFTSADGSKRLWAEVQGYDAEKGDVTLLLTDKRRITSPVSAFTADDKTYVEKAALALAAGRNLALRFEDAEKVVSEKKNPANGYQTKKSKNGFELNVRNNGQTTFKGLKAEYQIFYAAYVNPFKDRARSHLVTAGKVDLPELDPRKDANVNTDAIDMTSITRLPMSQCVGGT
jgi:hypothetical protein